MNHRRSAAGMRGDIASPWIVIFVGLAAGTATCASPRAQAAQPEAVAAFPSKPVRFIVPFTPGAGPDVTGRVIAAKLSALWNQTVVVENRAGATGAIGVELAARAAPDGYTVCLISGSQTVNSAINEKLPYDLSRDLQGITQMTSLPYAVYVNVAVPVTGVRDLIAYAKTNPGRVNYASSGAGGLQHFAGELFARSAKVKLTHVPFKGTGAGVLAIISGEVQAGFSTLLGVKPHATAGKLRILGLTAAKRVPNAADYPLVAETLPGYEVDQWYGLVIAAGAPPALVARLNAAVVDALKSPEVIARLGADGSTPVGSSPGQFNAHIKAELIKWRKLAKEVNLVL